MANTIPSLPAPTAPYVDKSGRPATEFYLFLKNLLTRTTTPTAYDAGTKSSGTFTPNVGNGERQRYVNNGAHAIGKPADDCEIVILVTNGASAGTVTTSAFNKVSGSFGTTPGAVYFARIVVINGVGIITIA